MSKNVLHEYDAAMGPSLPVGTVILKCPTAEGHLRAGMSGKIRIKVIITKDGPRIKYDKM